MMTSPYLTWTGINVEAIKTDCPNLLGYFLPQLKKESKDKVVLDIGCGAGHLGMKARQFGARRVIALDNNPLLIDTLRSVIDKHNLDWMKVICYDAFDLPGTLDEPDLIVIGDSLPNNLLQGLWHIKLLDLAKSWSRVKIIPNKITLVGSIVKSNELNEMFKWNYGDMDEILDSVVIPLLQHSPIILDREPIDIKRYDQCDILACYDYDARDLRCGTIDVPADSDKLWLEIKMMLGDDKNIYKFNRQVNYIPLPKGAHYIKMLVNRRDLTNHLMIK